MHSEEGGERRGLVAETSVFGAHLPAAGIAYGHTVEADALGGNRPMAAPRQFDTRPNKGAGEPPSVLRQRTSENQENGAQGLPSGKGFPIQVGSELFRLSGASIMSDGLCISRGSSKPWPYLY